MTFVVATGNPILWRLCSNPWRAPCIKDIRMKRNSKKPLRLTIETIRHLEPTQLDAVNGGSNTNAAKSTMYALSCGNCTTA